MKPHELRKANELQAYLANNTATAIQHVAPAS